jgi:hypothetical protein
MVVCFKQSASVISAIQLRLVSEYTVGCNTEKLVMLKETSKPLNDYHLKDFSEKLIIEKLYTEIATLVNSIRR